MLFFGCRHKKNDFIYEEELLNYRKSGALTSLHTAFSRDQAEKEYVTHHLLANSKLCLYQTQNLETKCCLKVDKIGSKVLAYSLTLLYIICFTGL